MIVEFELTTSPTTLTIADDGVGMNVRGFEENWMRPGYSEKGARTVRVGAPPNSSPARARELARVPVGEKGIGRLAAGRLGERLDVYTRRARNQPWLHVHFDWTDFDNMDRAIDEVDIHHDFESPPENPPFPVGTILVISDLSQKWGERVRGRAVRGRRRTKLGRLKQDLEFLVRPLAVQEDSFTIRLLSDAIREDDDIGEITPVSAVQDAELTWSFSYGTVDGTPQIRRTVSRGAEAAELSGQGRIENLPPVVIDDSSAEAEGRPRELVCGPFEGVFLYNPPPAAQRAREIDESVVGVLLYRDGLLVEPYGIGEDDWLGVRARKAQRQGHAAIQPDTLTGHVLITRRRNRALRDQTNRLGLLENPESENFLDHVRAEFGAFEKLVLHEVVEQRWESKGEKATKRAQESQERSIIFLRSLAHAIRQPLQGLGWEIVSLEELSERTDIPGDARNTLRGIAERASEHVGLAERLIAPLLDQATPEFSETSAAELVEDAVKQNRLLIESKNANIEINRSRATVLVPGPLVVQALAAVVANALEASRPEAVPVEVSIKVEQADGNVVVSVTDNGTGIAQSNGAISAIESTKGRPAAGLRSAELAMTAARGRLVLAGTGARGTTFELHLPTKVKGLSQ